MGAKLARILLEFFQISFDVMGELDINTEILDTLADLSKLLNTGLDKESILILIRLIELGVYPETLADLVIEIRKEISMIKHTGK